MVYHALVKVRLQKAKESELLFFRRHCEGFSSDKKLELVFRLEFLLLFFQEKSKRENKKDKIDANVLYEF
jgi:hypothetical protein